MLEKLEPKKGEKILDIGSGSGWTTALLAYIVSKEPRTKNQEPNKHQEPRSKDQKGKVIAVEVVPELVEFGEKNVATL